MEDLTAEQSIEVQDESFVELFPLTINEERNRYGEYYVGSLAARDFVGLPAEGVRALRLFQQGLSVKQVARRLQDDGYGVDVRAFVQDLWDLGFVRSVGGRSAVSPVAQGPGAGGLSAPPDRWPFLTPLVVLGVALALAGVAVMVTNRRYLPRWQDFFWHESYSFILVVGLVVNWLRLAGHELAHWGAARALGVKGQFTLSTRLWFVVGQTRFRDLWRLPKRERCLVYLAGMLHDLVAVASLALYLWVYDRFNPYGGELLYRFAKALILGFTLGLVWQFNFYMRTDVYQFLADFADCTNLFNDAKTYLLCKVAFWSNEHAPREHHQTRKYSLRSARSLTGAVKGSVGDLAQREGYFQDSQPVAEGLALGEKRAVRLYSLILAGGTLMAVLVFAFYQVPAIVTVLGNATTNLSSQPVSHWQPSQWDSLAVLVLISANLVLLAVLLMRRILAKPAGAKSALSH